MRAGRTWTITTIPRRIHERGDVILVRFPHPSGLRGKKRPAVIVQSDGTQAAWVHSSLPR